MINYLAGFCFMAAAVFITCGIAEVISARQTQPRKSRVEGLSTPCFFMGIFLLVLGLVAQFRN
jgi:hypothetical protein